MAKVWLVSTGSYSDFRIRAAFADEAKAQELADMLDDGWSGGEVHEFELLTEIPKRQVYWHRSGTVRYVYMPDPSGPPHFHTQGEDPNCVYCRRAVGVFDHPADMRVVWPWSYGELPSALVNVNDYRANKYAPRAEINIEVNDASRELVDRIFQDAVGRAKAKLEGVTD